MSVWNEGMEKSTTVRIADVKLGEPLAPSAAQPLAVVQQTIEACEAEVAEGRS